MWCTTKFYSQGQFKQVEVVDKILSKKSSGFFIEAGACDGESISNSLFFEVKRKWSGLLVRVIDDQLLCEMHALENMMPGM